MADFVNYESLSREERLHRIGLLLCKAVSLVQARKDQFQNTTSEPPNAYTNSGTSNPVANKEMAVPKGVSAEDLALLLRFDRLGGIAPREAMKIWGTSRSTTHRRLMHLEDAGWLVSSGSTRATRYSLSGQARSFLAKEGLLGKRTSSSHAPMMG